MKTAVTTLTAIAALLAFSGCNATNSSIDAAALLETRCGVCHKVDIPKSARKSKKEWHETVTRMIAKGAKLSPEEKKALIDHLAEVYRR